MVPAKIKVVTEVDVQVATVKGLNAVLDDGTTIAVTGPLSVGDEAVKDAQGNITIMSAADFKAAVVA